jgi:hypothetical protein
MVNIKLPVLSHNGLYPIKKCYEFAELSAMRATRVFSFIDKPIPTAYKQNGEVCKENARAKSKESLK